MRRMLMFSVFIGFSLVRAGSAIAQWVQQSSGTTENLVGVGMLHSANAIAVGHGSAILRTTDAGATWSNNPLPVNTVCN